MSDDEKQCEVCEDLTLVYMTGYSKAKQELLADPTPEEIEAVAEAIAEVFHLGQTDAYSRVEQWFDEAEAALTKFIELRMAK